MGFCLFNRFNVFIKFPYYRVRVLLNSINEIYFNYDIDWCNLYTYIILCTYVYLEV